MLGNGRSFDSVSKGLIKVLLIKLHKNAYLTCDRDMNRKQPANSIP